MNLKWKTGDRKEILSDRKPNRKSNIMKKATVLVVLASSITFNTGFAKGNQSNELQEIFHIYVSDEYIGAVSDEDVVKDLVEEKITATSSQFDDLRFSEGSDISIVSEQVFNKETDDTKTIDKLGDLVTVAADAFALSVNDEIAVYVKDLKSYHEVIRKLKLQAISEKELTELEARQSSKESLPPLRDNETRILDIGLKESVSGVTQQVKPETIMTVDEAVRYLQKGTLEEKTYKVQVGDVFSKIATQHNLTSEELTKLNKGVSEASVLQIGQQLKVTEVKPLVNIEIVREKKETKEVEFENQVKNSPEMLKGDSKVLQTGSNGAKEVTYRIREHNGIPVSTSIQQEVIVKEVKNNIVTKGTKVIPSRGSGKFSWPAEGGYISSEMGRRWGREHRGIDIARPSGFAIKAADNGVVISAGQDGTYGNRVVVDHKNGFQTTYAHLASINVKKGQIVSSGSKLGVMGSTGRSTGIHLHFEVRKNGAIVNPLNYLR